MIVIIRNTPKDYAVNQKKLHESLQILTYRYLALLSGILQFFIRRLFCFSPLIPNLRCVEIANQNCFQAI